MNIFGFLAVICACVTGIIITLLILRYLNKRAKMATTPPQFIEVPTKSTENTEKTEAELNKNTVTQNSMDAVISSVNRLMGIDVEEGENDTN